MSFDALIMPPAPQPPAGGTGSAPGAQSASFKLDRPAHSAAQNKSFLATLNRISADKSCSRRPSGAGEIHSVKPSDQQAASTNPQRNAYIAGQESVEDQAAALEAPASTAPAVCQWAPMGWIHQYLLNMAFTDNSAVSVEGQPDATGGMPQDFLNQLMGLFHAAGQLQGSGLAGLGPFEQMPAGISAQARNLLFFKQLITRVRHDQLAADPSGRWANNSFVEFWRSLTAAPPEGLNPGVRTDAFAAKVDELIHFLLQRYDHTTTVSGPHTETANAGGQQPAVHLEAFNAGDHVLLQKMTGTTQPLEKQPANADKGNLWPAEAAKDGSAETLFEPRALKAAEESAAAKIQPGPKAAEAAVNPNVIAGGIAAKSADETVSLKTTALQSDLLAAEPTGNKVIQIDGDSKDSGFLSSQENMPEHLSKLENSNRLAEGSQRSLASQTMNQIVQKAVLLNNNGQHTVQIDLKPDFLGHIRMQIITESQQVAVRIVAELPIVKDMLESNLNQLRAELQAQGLEVDELDVSVAHDSRAEEDRYQKAAEARRARALKNNDIPTDGDANAQADRRAGHHHGMVQSAIDYFA